MEQDISLKKPYYQPLMNPLCELVIQTGLYLGLVFKEREFQVYDKDDGTPVTDADLKAHQYLVRNLTRWTPHFPVVSEENYVQPDVSQAPYYWLVDPLDGTRSFAAGEGEFVVMVTLMERHEPVMGVMYHPLENTLAYALKGNGTFVQKQGDVPRQVHVRVAQPEHIEVLHSRTNITPETERYLSSMPQAARRPLSSAWKFVEVAQGNADMYPRIGTTHEWDVAIGQLFVENAGGMFRRPDGGLMRYGNPDFTCGGFVATGLPPRAEEEAPAS